MGNDNVRERSPSFTEHARILQQGIKTDFLPLINKLSPIRLGQFKGHKVLELKNPESSNVGMPLKSLNIQNKNSLILETAEKVGTNIGRFINLISILFSKKSGPVDGENCKVKETSSEPKPAEVFQKSLSNESDSSVVKKIDSKAITSQIVQTTKLIIASNDLFSRAESILAPHHNEVEKSHLEKLTRAKEMLKNREKELDDLITQLNSSKPISGSVVDHIKDYEEAIAAVNTLPPSSSNQTRLDSLIANMADLQRT